MNELKNIEALIHLIDDPDTEIYQHVRDRLMQYGPEAIPYLENSWGEKDYGLIFLTRVEQLIHDIQFEYTKQQLIRWKNNGKDLLEGALIVASYQYPGLEFEHVREFVQHVRKAIWLELNPRMTSLEKTKVFNTVFYDQFGFKGDSKNFHSPLNSFINTVIEGRKGNPLSLSILYSVIAQSLDLPIYGVNLPNHFILAYMDEDGINQFFNQSNKSGVLYYINAFSKGTLLDEKELIQFIQQLNLEVKREYLEPCSNTTIIKRMITNLISSFQQAGNSEKTKELKELWNLL
jgi:regulator of sirC expression with transglutaminase-like and TPR domain